MSEQGRLQAAFEKLLAQKKHRSVPNPSEEKADHVYVIGGDGRSLKIGVSNNPRRRLSYLQHASPQRLRLLYSIQPTSRSAFIVERDAHEMLAHWRISGEWFSCIPCIAQVAVEAAAHDCARLRLFVNLARDYAVAQSSLATLMKAGKSTVEVSTASYRLSLELREKFPFLAEEIAPLGRQVRNARAPQGMENEQSWTTLEILKNMSSAISMT